nr:single-pass membrane and coiled-coil domain-containing protein 2 isoform X4 [Oryctolagus cuniculus]
MQSAKEMALSPTNLKDETSLPRQTDEKEQLLTEGIGGSLQKHDAAEGAAHLLSEMTKMDHFLGRSDDEDVFSEDPHPDVPPEGNRKTWDAAELGAEHARAPPRGQEEQEADLADEDPQASTSLQFSENFAEMSRENMFRKLNYWSAKMGLQVRELGADHVDWVEKINNIIQKINLTENTVKSLLKEVMFLEGQTEKVEDQDLDPNQGANIEAKIMEIRKQLEEMDKKFAQGDACDEAHELKEKLIGGIELVALFSQNFCKDMTLLNSKLGMYQTQQGKTDSDSSEETSVEGREQRLPQARPPAGVQSAPAQVTAWKRALRIFIMVYVLTFTGISCYILFFDATFIFERVLPTVLGRHTVWELREIIAPFLNLEVEDLLPS